MGKDRLAILVQARKKSGSTAGGSSSAAGQGSSLALFNQSSKRTPNVGTQGDVVMAEPLLVGAPCLEEAATVITQPLKRTREEMGKIVVEPPVSTGNESLTIRSHPFSVWESVPLPGELVQELYSDADDRSLANHAGEVLESLDPIKQERRRSWSTREQELLAEVEVLKKEASESSQELTAKRLEKEEAEKKLAAVEKANESEEAGARLDRMKKKALKYNRSAEQNILFWNQTHNAQFLNALSQLSLLNPKLQVLGSHPDFEIQVDKAKFDEATVVLSDSEAKVEA
ncbi:hypothetical protein RIF29_26172 [Crotalaria pallida]|uniref:Uncharacterized protein n=1 Tax=Crotalaria pallida TaxID=3830 RepID=A0AAN9ESF0_CROPI